MKFARSLGKRLFDVGVSAAGLAGLSAVVAPVLFLVWRGDGHSPFYVAARIGEGRRPFRMVKIRSMVIGADRSGVDSTSSADPRITSVGRFVRRTKLDEVPQLWNVLRGEMSLVGPRPNVERGVAVYTDVELGLLAARPGITDLASIVFADEGAILADSADPDLDYDRLIRPWKSRLGLLYVEQASLRLDVEILALTVLSAVSRDRALAAVQRILERLGADPELLRVAARQDELQPHAPPGTDVIAEVWDPDGARSPGGSIESTPLSACA